VCNTVCDVLQGRIIDIQFCQLFLKPSKEKIDFLLEVRNYLKLEGKQHLVRYLFPHITVLLLQVMLRFLKQRKIICKVTSQTLFSFFAVSTIILYVISLASMSIALLRSVGEEPGLSCSAWI